MTSHNGTCGHWSLWLPGGASALCVRHVTCSHQPSVCVAGMALADIGLCFAWQLWHLLKPTFVLCGRCCTCLLTSLFCMAGVALGHIDLCFVWQAWRLDLDLCLHGRHGTYGLVGRTEL